MQTAGTIAARELASLLRARNPLIWITTREESRAERGILQAAEIAQYSPVFWDCATGLTKFDGSIIDAEATDPAGALAIVRSNRERRVYVFRDLANKWLDDPTVSRAVRTLARNLQLAPRDEARAVIILTPRAEIPPELAGHAVAINWPLPDRAEIAEILAAALEALPDDIRANAAPNGTRDAAIDAAVGLTDEEARACYSKSLVTSRTIDPATVSGEKKKVISRERVLEWIDVLPGGLDLVGGYDLAKAWLLDQKLAFSKEAREYGIPAPKGALMVGVQGCGKSLMAKAVASAYGFPLLRLDMGALKSKWVGESESNIRKALSVAETIAPCVLWLDEIEKAMAAATQGAADGGVSSDALGTILTWMQERQGQVFMVATSNDVSAMPPELLRKGRFDEVFFIDLPNRAERCDIVKAGLRQYRIANAAEIDVAAIADASAEFIGAEIVAAMPRAMIRAFKDGKRNLQTADIMAEIQATVPLSKTASEKIGALRKWAVGRARPASTPEASTASNARKLDI